VSISRIGLSSGPSESAAIGFPLVAVRFFAMILLPVELDIVRSIYATTFMASIPYTIRRFIYKIYGIYGIDVGIDDVYAMHDDTGIQSPKVGFKETKP
jgi:hypothetical protein